LLRLSWGLTDGSTATLLSRDLREQVYFAMGVVGRDRSSPTTCPRRLRTWIVGTR